MWGEHGIAGDWMQLGALEERQTDKSNSCGGTQQVPGWWQNKG